MRAVVSVKGRPATRKQFEYDHHAIMNKMSSASLRVVDCLLGCGNCTPGPQTQRHMVSARLRPRGRFTVCPVSFSGGFSQVFVFHDSWQCALFGILGVSANAFKSIDLAIQPVAGAANFEPARQQRTLGPRPARARVRARMRAATPSSSLSRPAPPPRLSIGERCFGASLDLHLAAAAAAFSGRRRHRAAAPVISLSLLARSAALVRFWGARYGTLGGFVGG